VPRYPTSSGFPTKILHKFFIIPICATCPTYLILFHLITLTKLSVN
jgi:hypothetical protein